MLSRWRVYACLAGPCRVAGWPRRAHDIFRGTSTPYVRKLTKSTTWTNTQLSPSQTDSLRQRRKDIIPTPDTIYALSTAPGRAAIAVVRISGPACLDIYGALCPDRLLPHPRTATLRKLTDPHDATRVLDPGALVLYFPAPKTVTGEDVLELHVHGGPAIVRSVLEAIPACIESRPRRRTVDYSYIRAAEPGEFTKRAFYNGRLDLTQAEALGETLAAETEQQRRLAVAGADSGLAVRYEEWRKRLLYARGEVEALIDFSEDQHFDESPVDFIQSVVAQVTHLHRHIQLHIHNASRGELLREGISVALLGAPNAGKSSLLNRIVGREAAIVSTEAGTTRDIVDVTVDVGGWLVRLGDMAGLRGERKDYESPHVESRPDVHDIGVVEQEGIRRARERALQSDLVIVLISLVRGDHGVVELSLNPELLDAVQQCQHAGKELVYAVNKMDLLPLADRVEAAGGLRQRVFEHFSSAHQGNVFLISCKDDGAVPSPPSASSSTSGPALTPSTPLSPLNSQQAEPGASGVQTLLTGLIHTFTSMTSAATESDPTLMSIGATLSPADAQSYWSTSLSVSHRQSMYLQQCLGHLEDFLAQCTPRGEAAVVSSHHVDGHDDLVGERARETGDTALEREQVDIVTAAEHLRYAAECLAKITGRGHGGDVEDVLGVVFDK